MVCAGLLAVLFLGTGEPAFVDTPPHVALGKPAPRLDLIRLGDTMEMNDLTIPLQDRVTLLHFWGTWCSPCRAEYPRLVEVVSKLESDERFQFVPVSCQGSSGETLHGLWKKTSAFLMQESINSPAFADPRGVTRMSLADRFEQPHLYFPTSVLIRSDGKIAGVWEGYTESGVDEIEELAKRLIANDPLCCLSP